MSLPSYPRPSGPLSSADPGLYPLRPLAVGELLGAGLRIAARHLAVLAPVAFVVAMLTSAVNLLVLAANGSLDNFASGDYARIPANATSAQLNDQLSYVVSHILPALAASALLSLVAAPVLAGIATPFAALAATTRTGSNAAGLARLRGRWPVLLGLGVVVGLATAVGYLFLLVPGILVWLVFLPAGPVAAMEGSGIADSMRRASVLSKGFKGRLFGVSLLIGLIVGAIGLVVESILGQLVSTTDPTTHLIITQGLSTLVSAVLQPWSLAVVALLYIDLRMRRENLAQALLASTARSW